MTLTYPSTDKRWDATSGGSQKSQMAIQRTGPSLSGPQMHVTVASKFPADWGKAKPESV